MASGKIQKSSDAIMQDIIGSFFPSQRSTWQTFNLQEPIKDDAIYTLNVHVDSGYSGYGFTAKGSVLKSVNEMMHPFHLVDDVPRSDATALYACFPSDSEFSLYVASGLWEGLNVGVRIIKIYDEIPTTYVPYIPEFGEVGVDITENCTLGVDPGGHGASELHVYKYGKLVIVDLRYDYALSTAAGQNSFTMVSGLPPAKFIHRMVVVSQAIKNAGVIQISPDTNIGCLIYTATNTSANDAKYIHFAYICE